MDSFMDRFKQTAFIRLYTFWNIPLIWWIRPSVIEMGKKKTELKIALNRRTKNHLNSMYFGALAIGAELVIAAKSCANHSGTKKKSRFCF